jgi:hypothetical protein
MRDYQQVSPLGCEGPLDFCVDGYWKGKTTGFLGGQLRENVMLLGGSRSLSRKGGGSKRIWFEDRLIRRSESGVWETENLVA